MVFFSLSFRFLFSLIFFFCLSLGFRYLSSVFSPVLFSPLSRFFASPTSYPRGRAAHPGIIRSDMVEPHRVDGAVLAIHFRLYVRTAQLLRCFFNRRLRANPPPAAIHASPMANDEVGSGTQLTSTVTCLAGPWSATQV